ncbi:transcriptional repressor [bacterium]|nr:transcriptional repressor [bacterium]
MKQTENAEGWAKEMIRSAGLRVTPARVATLDILLKSDSPLTHGEVFLALREMNFDKATVFRNLNDLVTASVLRRSELGDHVWRFEVIHDSEREHSTHPHFVCVDCGSVSCMEKVELTKKSQSLSLNFGHITEILLRGHCKNCT